MQPSYHGAPAKPNKKIFLHPSGRIPKDNVEIPSKKSSKLGSSETTPLLVNAVQLARETEDIASKTMQAVEEQGESLDSTAIHVKGVEEATSSAYDHLKAMSRKVFNKKLCLWVVMVALGVANVGMLLVMIKNHGHLYSAQ